MTMMLTFHGLTVYLLETATPYVICHWRFAHIFTGRKRPVSARLLQPFGPSPAKFSNQTKPGKLRGEYMQERRQGARHVVSFPIRVKWKNEDGRVMVEEGLTENVGQNGALIYLPR